MADALLADALTVESGTGELGELWSRRALVNLGAGNDDTGRDYLGHSLRLGSRNGAVLLGRLDLRCQRWRAARQTFRALLHDPEPGAWALRGWGLGLLAELGSDAPPQPTNGVPSRSPSDG